jgi:hypothetical protein
MIRIEDAGSSPREDSKPHLILWTNMPSQSGRNSRESMWSQRVIIRSAAFVAGTMFRDLAEHSPCIRKGAGEVVRQRLLVELPVVQTISVDAVPQAHQLVNIQAAVASGDRNPVEAA